MNAATPTPSENSRPALGHCLNCERPVSDNFCAHCGQENSDYRVSLKRLLGDLFEELFQLEARVWRSLAHLFRHPGRLTADYNAGRRVRYTSPLRLYLMASVSYFFVATVLPTTKSDVQIDFSETAQAAKELGAPDNPLDRRVRERIGLQTGMPMADVQRRTRDALFANAPKVMAVLVPLFALSTLAFFRKPRLFFVEHLVLALHFHAVTFGLLLAGLLTRWQHASMVAVALAFVWLLLALRAIFEQRWWRTAVKAAFLSTIYLTFVGFGIIVALVV
ncbi:MAG TPA: DUF3667 domain-containing protein [Polyangia bacterium]|jgi:hypothetical protein|nr:DUF3667 domain-containing protein [Polyangia bacterium]HWE28286.1 DUF3667 domain-containing protein [Polyangia bacterium]